MVQASKRNATSFKSGQSGNPGAAAKTLTEKQGRFARAYVETGCASTAYRRAYDAKAMKDNVVHVKACELLKNGKVAVRVEQLRAEHRERHDITVDSLTHMLMEEREIAHKAKRPAVDAVMGIAKLHGLITDKSKNEHMGPDGKPIQPVLNVTMGVQEEAEAFTASITRLAKRMQEQSSPEDAT